MQNENKLADMDAKEIRILLLKNNTTQAEIARGLNVRPQLISNVINGRAMSDRVCREVSRRTKTDVRLLWPSRYLYNDRPKPGRKINKKRGK